MLVYKTGPKSYALLTRLNSSKSVINARLGHETNGKIIVESGVFS